jgi:hypothetical protein
VSARALATPACVLTRGVSAVCPTPQISELSGFGEPLCCVTCSGTHQRVSNFVEQNLLNVLLGSGAGEIARERDAHASVIALAEAGFGVVKTKRPPGTEAVEGKKFVCSLFNPVCCRHC